MKRACAGWLLGERIRVSGTPFALYYRSDRIQRSQSNSFPEPAPR